jgi:hypothetical protein
MPNIDYGKLHEEILTHPGYRLYQLINAHSTSKNILSGNCFQLRKLLEVLHDPKNIDRFWALENRQYLSDLQGEAIRHFHNFLASVKTVVEHTRNCMRDNAIRPEHRTEYQKKIEEVFMNDPLSKFLEDFRNFMLHRSLPLTEMTLDISTSTSTLYVDLTKMEDWERWTESSRRFITANKPKVSMMRLVDEYEEKAKAFYAWFYPRFQHYYEGEIDAALALQRKWNAGLGPER